MRVITPTLRNLREEIKEFSRAYKSQPSPSYRWDIWGLRTFSFRFGRQLLTEHQQPHKVGLAIFWGLFIGCTPFFGFHLLLCLAIAFLLRLNKLIVYGAANISLPVFAPILIFTSYQIGHLIFHGALAEVSLESVKQHGVDSLLYWLTGSIILGSSLGSIGGFLAWVLLARRQNKLDPFRSATSKLHDGFRASGRFAAGLAKGKVGTDPLYRKLCETITPEQSILDLGGGQGYLCIMHKLLHGGSASHNVWDWDGTKLQQGRSAAAKLGLSNLEFKKIDVFAIKDFPASDVICLLDVLHYQPIERQNALLKKIAGAMSAGQVLYIRDMDADLGWRTSLTLLQERCSLGFGLTKARQLHPQSGAALMALLKQLGFEPSYSPCWRGTPFANVLITATRI